MKLYFYDLCREKIKVQSEEFEEKPKTYTSSTEVWARIQIKKSQVGKMKGHWKADLILTEDNVEKAKEIFIDYKKAEIRSKKRDIEYLQKEIEKLEEDIRKLEEN